VTRVFSLFREQQDDQIELGNPTRLLGFFTTEEHAKRALDAVQRHNPQAMGKLEIYPQVLDSEGWNDGFVTEYATSD
jgi:hypothetical protein